ncbi:MAG: hypothetical protein M4579_007227 [Chaenotheca gracillima]|nr:MAG: hypothetical protein M4579_007227 [Chaenotheca gracillima]
MKFAHEYLEALEHGDFPPAWIDSAVSYRQLKKCIKKVQEELASFGLDPVALKHLVDSTETARVTEVDDLKVDQEPVALQYAFGDEQRPRPKLTLIVIMRGGVPVNAGLSEETREFLSSVADSHGVARHRQGSNQESSAPQDSIAEKLSEISIEEKDVSSDSLSSPDSKPREKSGLHSNRSKNDWEYERIEIPLTSDSEFFGVLQRQVSAVDELGHREQAEMIRDVVQIGDLVSKVTSPDSHSSRSDLQRWRKILELYIQANVFFSTKEKDRGARSAAGAAQQLQWFSDEAARQCLGIKFGKKDSFTALSKFLAINAQLIRNLRFQEINNIATTKILKKFEKRTALDVKDKLPQTLIRQSASPSTVAKAICFKISEEIVTVVPQLNDYLCPICFSISYKPVRLKCGHLFCIRCMVVMQRASDKSCPLCRGDVVMDADSANLDPAMMAFLKRFFPDEVKTKQKENERAAAVDKFGEDYNKCAVM